ncbi:hypothetical protein IWQ61_004457 [Dispira simplex]|nr:hypothetical protein IWQ61_004457 [Dispira simplex]
MADWSVQITQLLELGIEFDQAQIALGRCNNDVTRAANYIFSGGLDNCPMDLDPSRDGTEATYHFNSPRPSSPKANLSATLVNGTTTPPNNDLTTHSPDDLVDQTPTAVVPFSSRDLPPWFLTTNVTKPSQQSSPPSPPSPGRSQAIQPEVISPPASPQDIVVEDHPDRPRDRKEEDDQLYRAIQASLQVHTEQSAFDLAQYHSALYDSLEQFRQSSSSDSDLPVAIDCPASASVGAAAIVSAGRKRGTSASEWSDPTSPLDRRRSTSSTPVGLRPVDDAPLFNSTLQAYLFVPGIAQLLWRVVAPNFEWPSSEGFWNGTGQALTSGAIPPLDMLTDQVRSPTATFEDGESSRDEAQSWFVYELARLYGFMMQSKRGYVDSTCVLDTVLGRHPPLGSKGVAEALVRYLDEFTHQMAKQKPAQRPEEVADRGGIPRLRSTIQSRPNEGEGHPGVSEAVSLIDLPRQPNVTHVDPEPCGPPCPISLYKLLDAVADQSNGHRWVLQSIADVLFLRLPPPDSSTTRIRLEKNLWLDRYLSENVSQADAVRLLEQQAQRIRTELQSTSSLDLLNTSEKILDTLATNTVLVPSPYVSPTDEGTDWTSIARLKSRLTQTQDFLTRVKRVREEQQQAVHHQLQSIQHQVTQILNDPALKQTSYHLHAAIFAQSNASGIIDSWVYIRRSDTQDHSSCPAPAEPMNTSTGWWRIRDNVVEFVKDATLEAEDTRQLLGIIYISDRLHEESPPELPPSLADNVRTDNIRFTQEMRNWLSPSTSEGDEVPGPTKLVLTSPSHGESLKYNQLEKDAEKLPIQTGDSPWTKDAPGEAETVAAGTSLTHSGQNLNIFTTAPQPSPHQALEENTDNFHTAEVNGFINEAVALENNSPTILHRIDIFLYRVGLKRTIISFWSRFTTAMSSPSDEDQLSLWQLLACAPYRPCYEEYRNIAHHVVGGLQATLAEEYYEAIQIFKHAYVTNLEWTCRYATLPKETDPPAVHTLTDQPLPDLSKQGEIVDYLRYCFRRLNHMALCKVRQPAFRTRGLEDGLSVAQLLMDTVKVAIPLTLAPGHTGGDGSFIDKLRTEWFTIHDATLANVQPWTLQQVDLLNRIVDVYTTRDFNPVNFVSHSLPSAKEGSYALPHGPTTANSAGVSPPTYGELQQRPLVSLQWDQGQSLWQVYQTYQTRLASIRAD